MKKLFFSSSSWGTDVALLLLRIGTSLMMMTHGWAKIIDFSARLTTFRDPIGLGPAMSLQATIFAEFFCSILLALGFMTRLSLIPLIFTMTVVSFIVHAEDPFAMKEKALLFLLIFIVQFIMGPGKFSVDAQIRKRRNGY
ncbi:DoxX family protein [Cecembia rubra]|uniref:Putative oxidoreductase n=1 Tax=Cecembia rubra TaxID=1485585 RepID=A0A2P8DTF7_9BACT|nr:DoxX family protein [Cecembia rubra]PSL00485.1 putative oxidoreductase [Cecembia rubra]